MPETLTSIDELLRIPAPCPQPHGIACDGTLMWIGSFETHRLCGIDPRTGAMVEEAQAPGRLYGLTVLGDELRAVVGDDDSDDRAIARYVIGHGFKNDKLPCPDATGSFLAYDGDFLFLSQRFNRQILELDATGEVRRTIHVPREICGMTIVDGCFYLLTTQSKEVDDFRLLRVDARKEPAISVELAAVPFAGRGLAFDGARFWTNFRSGNQCVAFARPDAA